MGINGIKHWLHHLFNPHCEICRAEALQAELRTRHCETCEVLKQQLAILQRQNEVLFDRVLPVKPIVEEKKVEQQESPKPIFPLGKPWRVKQRELEAQDRALAADKAREKEELKKLGITKEVTVETLDEELENAG